jgi:tetratricopeptide (TPR) repeat protein
MFSACALALPLLAQATGGSPADASLAVEAHELAQRVVNALNAGNPKILEAALDYPDLVRRACADFGLDTSFELELARDLGRAAGTPNSFAVRLLEDVGPFGYFKLIRFQSEHSVKALVRASGEGGYEFVEFEFHRGLGRHVRIREAHGFVGGFSLLEGLRGLAALSAAEKRAGLRERLTDASREAFYGIQAAQRMRTLANAGRTVEALDVFDQLPTSIRQLKVVQLDHARLAAGLSPARFRLALQELRELCPEEPTADFLAIDVHVLDECWDEALACLDRLELRIGPDAYLRFLRGNVLAMALRVEPALDSWEAAIAREPELVDPYWELLGWRVARGEFEAAVELLTALETKLRYERCQLEPHLATLDGWSALARSEAFALWKRTPPPPPVGPGD